MLNPCRGLKGRNSNTTKTAQGVGPRGRFLVLIIADRGLSARAVIVSALRACSGHPCLANPLTGLWARCLQSERRSSSSALRTESLAAFSAAAYGVVAGVANRWAGNAGSLRSGNASASYRDVMVTLRLVDAIAAATTCRSS